jgi:hypothetical protein
METANTKPASEPNVRESQVAARILLFVVRGKPAIAVDVVIPGRVVHRVRVSLMR